MVETVTKLPVKTEARTAMTTARPWYGMDTLRHEIDRLFSDFDAGFSLFPFRHNFFNYVPAAYTPAAKNMLTVDVVGTEHGYEITAELPGVDEKDIEVKVVDGGLLIRGEKKEAKEEKQKGYVVSERNYGSFERYFSLPEGVDVNKIAATFAKGILSITLPKTEQSKLQERKIAVKAA